MGNWVCLYLHNDIFLRPTDIIGYDRLKSGMLILGLGLKAKFLGLELLVLALNALALE